MKSKLTLTFLICFITLWIVFNPSDYAFARFFEDNQYQNIQGYESLDPLERAVLKQKLSDRATFYVDNLERVVFAICIQRSNSTAEDNRQLIAIIECTNDGFITNRSKIFPYEENISATAYFKILIDDEINGFQLSRNHENIPFVPENIELGTWGLTVLGNQHSQKTLYIIPVYHRYLPIQVSVYNLLNEALSSGLNPEETVLYVEGMMQGSSFQIHGEFETNPQSPVIQRIILQSSNGLNVSIENPYIDSIAESWLHNSQLSGLETIYLTSGGLIGSAGVETRDLYVQTRECINSSCEYHELSRINRDREREIFSYIYEHLTGSSYKNGILTIGAGHVFNFPENTPYPDFQLHPTIQTLLANDDIRVIILLPKGFLEAPDNVRMYNRSYQGFDTEMEDSLFIRIRREMEGGYSDDDINLRSPPYPVFFRTQSYDPDQRINYYMKHLLALMRFKLWSIVLAELKSNFTYITFHIAYNPSLQLERGLVENAGKNFIFIAVRNYLTNEVLLLLNEYGTEYFIERGVFDNERNYFILRYNEYLYHDLITSILNGNEIDPRPVWRADLSAIPYSDIPVELIYNRDYIYQRYFNQPDTLAVRLRRLPEMNLYYMNNFFEEILQVPPVNTIEITDSFSDLSFRDYHLSLPVSIRMDDFHKTCEFLQHVNYRSILNSSGSVCRIGYNRETDTTYFISDGFINILHPKNEQIIPYIFNGIAQLNNIHEFIDSIDYCMNYNLLIYN